jgi:protein involved in polysaccharide export with SLBB domain
MNMPTHVCVRRLRLVAVLGLVLVPLVVRAADPPVRPAYRIGVGDILEIWVAGHVELSVVNPPGIEVGLDGRIRYPYLGGVTVEGATCEEVEQRLAAGLAGRVVVDPQVVVRVVQCRSQQINVLGAVITPGAFPYRPGLTVADAAALAGGLQLTDEKTTPLVQARLVRRDGRVESLPVDAVLSGATAGRGPELSPGDTLLFEVEARVAVLGSVATPGAFTVQNGMRLSEVLAQARGVAPEGDLQRIIVSRRDGTVREYDLEGVLAKREGEDPVIYPGDVVYVPATMRQAVVLGFVLEPGRFILREGDRVSDLIAQAKGPLVTPVMGDLTRVVLARKDGSTRTLNLARTPGETPHGEDDPPLLPGDQVIVPQLRNRVMVSGYVRAPGFYEFQAGDRARSAIARAQGVVLNVGSLTAVQIRHRDGQQVVVNLERDDPELQPDDEIVVPFSRHRVTILGQISRPGMYECRPGDTVIDIVASAAGPASPTRSINYMVESGNLARVVLYRAEDDNESLRQLDLRRFLKQGDRSMNPEVQPGDIIYVPGKRTLNLGEILRDVLIIPRLLNLSD